MFVPLNIWKGGKFMKITFYDTKVTEEHRIILIEEKTVDYSVENFEMPALIVEMVNNVTHLNEKGEEHCYMLAMDIKNRILGMFFISKGTKNQSVVGGREVFMRALLVGACFALRIVNSFLKNFITMGSKKVENSGLRDWSSL